MKHYWPDVPGLGNVAISRHAQARAVKHGITEGMIASALSRGTDTPDGLSEVFREWGVVRLVIVLRPTPFKGACLVKTITRIKPALNVT